MTKAQVLADLEAMLCRSMAATDGGGVHSRLARVQGYADGYMRALSDLGVVTQEDLLEVVKRAREQVRGPGWKFLENDRATRAA